MHVGLTLLDRWKSIFIAFSLIEIQQMLYSHDKILNMSVFICLCIRGIESTFFCGFGLSQTVGTEQIKGQKIAQHAISVIIVNNPREPERQRKKIFVWYDKTKAAVVCGIKALDVPLENRKKPRILNRICVIFAKFHSKIWACRVNH